MLPAGITWEIEDPSVVSMSGSDATSGGASAQSLGKVGSSRVVAVVGTVRSAPLEVTVANPKPGARFYDPAVVSTPSVTASPSGGLTGARLSSLIDVHELPDLRIGQVLLPRSDGALAGRITSLTAVNAETMRIEVESLSLPEMFDDLELRREVTVSDADSWYPASQPSVLADSSGPCTGSDSVIYVFSVDVTPKMTATATVSIRWGSVRSASVKITGTLTPLIVWSTPTSASFEIECLHKLRAIPFPLYGWMYGYIPLAAGIRFDAAAMTDVVNMSAVGRAGAIVELGFDYTEGGGMVPVQSVETVREANFSYGMYSTDQLRVETAGQVFGEAALHVQVGGFFTTVTFDLFKVRAGVKQTVNLATRLRQARDPAFKSQLRLEAFADFTPGDKLSALASAIGIGNLADAFDLEDPEPIQLSESPRGTWIAPATLKGYEAKQATVLLAPESIRFRGNDLVAGVNVAAIFNDPNQGGREVIQSLGQTGALSGQTSFTVDLDPRLGPMDEHTVTLAAFTSTNSVVAHDFELSADSTKMIEWNVCKYPSHCETGRCCNRPEEVSAAEYGACKACPTNCDDCSGYATTITPGKPLPGPCACTEAGQGCYLADNTRVQCESYGNGCKLTRTAAQGPVSYEHCP